MHRRKEAICNLQISGDPAYALGVHFTYDIELSHKKNFFEKLGSLTQVNKIVFDFIWKQKPAKIKKTTLVKKKSDGSLSMKDFVLFDKALKLTWVKRLCSVSDAPWKYVP